MQRSPAAFCFCAGLLSDERNSANNSGGNCFEPGGSFSDQGYNLESGTDCGFRGMGDLQNTDPKLDPNGLQNNGGPTQTLALEPDSAAVDQIPGAGPYALREREEDGVRLIGVHNRPHGLLDSG